MRRKFAEDNILLALVHATGATPEERQRTAVKMVNRAYDILEENWPKGKTPEVKNPYELMSEAEKKEFETLWAKTSREGSKQAAARAFLKVPGEARPKLLSAYKIYENNLGTTTRAHLSTWLNEERYLNYEVKVDAIVNQIKINEDQQEIMQLRRMYEQTGNEQLLDQIERIKERAK